MLHDHVLKTLNFDLLNPPPGSGEAGGGGGGGGGLQIFAAMLLHL